MASERIRHVDLTDKPGPTRRKQRPGEGQMGVIAVDSVDSETYTTTTQRARSKPWVGGCIRHTTF